MKRDIIEYAATLGLDMIGFTSAEIYNRHMGEHFKTSIVVLFPYYIGGIKGANLSKYSYGTDYHIVVKSYLTKIADHFNMENYKVFSDTGPAVDRAIAISAGLCFAGLNSMCINDKYGSYFFIGYIVCDIDVEFDMPNLDTCIMCKKCINACPSGAICDGMIDKEKCLSHLTQTKGDLDDNEKDLIKANSLIFGCDVCQDVCPHNENIESTHIAEFKENIITRLSLDDISDLTNKEFKSKYGDRAFSWRGKGILERNIRYVETE